MQFDKASEAAFHNDAKPVRKAMGDGGWADIVREAKETLKRREQGEFDE
jgi:hypothetical protein